MSIDGSGRGFLFAGIMSVGLLVGPACGSSDEHAAAGGEGGACYPNKTCDTGLSCASDLCVALGESESATPRPGDADAGPPPPPSMNVCKEGERATDFASCESDNECFSGNCCKRGMSWCGRQGDYPGYCVHPNTSAYKAGHGYSCESDADCESVAPDFIARGGTAHCYKDNLNDVPNGCGFDCTVPRTGGKTNGGSTVSGAGGVAATSGGTGAGGAEQSGGGPLLGAGGSAQGGSGQGAGGSAQGGSTQGAGGSTQSAGGSTQSAGGSTQSAGGSTQSAGGSTQGAGGSANSGGGAPSGAGGGSSAHNGGSSAGGKVSSGGS